MYRAGTPEIEAIAKVIKSGELFRYHPGGACERFETRWAEFLGVKHATMTSSGTTAIVAALAGLDIGPGDEVIVPAYTYMATAIGVLGVGASPVIVDVDESLTLDPKAMADAEGPRTTAVIPVHMVGRPCDMDAIMAVAQRKRLRVVEDACQAVGGGYRGRKLGSIGQAGTFSFNYYKNITCGEGGAIVTNDTAAWQKARCMVDCGSFYWQGRQEDVRPFAAPGARASEIEGAMLNAQLDQLPDMLAAMRQQKKQILAATADAGLKSIVNHSLDDECGTHVGFLFRDAAAAETFKGSVGGFIPGKTGRHVYTEWDPILEKRGSHTPALDPFKLPANKRCRMNYSKDMCPRSLDIINRAVLLGTHPDRTADGTRELIEKIRAAAH